jgi:hypothetical protein
MKRFLLLFNAILCFSVILNAQTIDVMLDGAAFSMISPSGQYIAGNIDDKAVYYNSATGYATSLEGENLDAAVLTKAVVDAGYEVTSAE